MTERRQCTATSKQTGKQCGSTPPPGFTVCQWHGGGAPQVRAKAEERLRDLVDPAINRLEKLIDATYDAVALAAVKDVLDRAGYAASHRLEHTGADGGPIQVEQDVTYAFEERQRRILAIVDAARGRPDPAALPARSDLDPAGRSPDESLADIG